MARLEGCPTCGNQTSENASLCPSCGEPLEPGWADRVAEQRNQAEEAAWQEARDAERDAVGALKKRKRKKLLIWLAIVSTLIAVFIAPPVFNHYYLKNLKQNDPEEYQRIISEREAVAEKRRLEEIQELEANVAKVPASNVDENIRLYEKLLELDPDNARYAGKLSHYEEKRRGAEAAAEERRLAAERAAEERRLAAKRAAAAAEAQKEERRLAAEAVKKRKGFHCLSAWDGSHRGVIQAVEKRLRDPDSFEHIETRISPVNNNGEHILSMEFRSRNGFGGMTVSVAMAKVRNSDCSATVLLIE